MIIKQTHKVLLRAKKAPIPSIPSFSTDKKPNVFSILHKTSYDYNHPVSCSKHLLRLQPLQDLQQTLLSHKSTISQKGSVCNFTGVFGNHASFVTIEGPYSKLSITSESIVSISAPTINMDLAHQPLTLPMIWMPWDRVMMQVYLQPPELAESELFALAKYAMHFAKKNNNDILNVLSDINQTIYQEYAYVTGSTTLFTTPYQVLRHRKGVCQDFANLFICLARLLSLPARYRMGYIYTGGDYKNKIQSDASHAWVEIYLPYIGWVGFDPTNGCMADKNHIKVSCGRHFNDATPTSGTIFKAPAGTQERLSTSVQVILL